MVNGDGWSLSLLCDPKPNNDPSDGLWWSLCLPLAPWPRPALVDALLPVGTSGGVVSGAMCQSVTVSNTATVGGKGKWCGAVMDRSTFGRIRSGLTGELAGVGLALGLGLGLGLLLRSWGDCRGAVKTAVRSSLLSCGESGATKKCTLLMLLLPADAVSGGDRLAPCGEVCDIDCCLMEGEDATRRNSGANVMAATRGGRESPVGS